VPTRIDSPQDPRLDEFRDVKDARLRAREGLFLVEGRRNVEMLLRQDRFPPRALFLTPAAERALGGVCREHRPDVPVYVAAQTLLNEVVGYDLHRGCIASAGRRDEDSAESLVDATTPNSLVVVAEDLTDTDNIGSLFRNALALGASSVLLSPRCCDPLYRKAVRVSLGAVMRLPYARARGWPDDLLVLRAAGYTLVALDPAEVGERGETLAGFGARAVGPLALIVGSEGGGLSDVILERADARVRIPMAAGSDSINVSTAAAIAIQQLVASRRPE